jgi:hypothetical protein
MSDFTDYPWVWPPDGFEPLDLNGSLAVLPNTDVNAFLPYTIPLLQNGWITQAGIELSGYPAGTYYTLTLAGNAIRNYERITVPLGAPNTPAILYIKLQPNQPFALRIHNASGGTIAARWRFYGWYYPQP